MNNIMLKWGTLKGWDVEEESEILRKINEFLKNSPVSCMADKPDKTRKKLLCEIIDMVDGEIENNWTGEILTKDQAKEYVMNYGR